MDGPGNLSGRLSNLVRPRPRLFASLLAADFARLGEEVAAVEPYVDGLHIDCMDGHFVPNLAVGPAVISSLRRATGLFFDAHLMMTNPDVLFDALVEAGTNLVSVHIESFPDPTRVVEAARRVGLGVGLVINPATPLEAVTPFVQLADLVLVMSVNPGWGGQTFIPGVIPKIEAARELIDSKGFSAEVQVDGGIDWKTAGLARAAGADVLVAGSAIFRNRDSAQAARQLKEVIEA